MKTKKKNTTKKNTTRTNAEALQFIKDNPEFTCLLIQQLLEAACDGGCKNCSFNPLCVGSEKILK